MAADFDPDTPVARADIDAAMLHVFCGCPISPLRYAPTPSDAPANPTADDRQGHYTPLIEWMFCIQTF